MTSQKENSIHNLWKAKRLDEDIFYRWQAGPLIIWLKKLDEDWLIAEERVEDYLTISPYEEYKETPDNLDWKRFVFKKGFKEIILTPCMADRPFVVTPNVPWIILEGIQAKCFINIPLWVKISLVRGKEKHELIRIPSKILSNTWFGDTFQGELCYAISTMAVQHFNELVIEPLRAVCLFKIENKKKSMLPVKKICVRPNFFNIYQADEVLWTSEVKVISMEEDKPSQLEYSKKAPSNACNSILIHEADENPGKSFFGDTFVKLSMNIVKRYF